MAKTLATTVFALCVSLLLGSGQPALGVPVGSYESGVPAASGNAGAADPATQGWTFFGSANNSGYY